MRFLLPVLTFAAIAIATLTGVSAGKPGPAPRLHCPDELSTPFYLNQAISKVHISVQGPTRNTPFTFAIGGGALPDGLSLSSGGDISGTPTVDGTFQFLIGVTDSTGASASVSCDAQVVDPPTTTEAPTTAEATTSTP